MTYDETWDDVPARRFPLAALAVVLALVARWPTAMYVVVAKQSGITGAERSAREAEVGKLKVRVAALESRNVALSGQLGSAEKSLKGRKAGSRHWQSAS